MDQDDEFDFADHELDELPANTLQQLETTALRATQHCASATGPESDYGLDDGDEVVNLDDAAGPPQASAWVAEAPQFTQHQQRCHEDNDAYHDAMEAGEQPRRSQADVGQLLLRIKKVGPTSRL